MEKTLILIRGIPGSGKSEFAKLLDIKAICCADDYFIHKGIYDFQPKKIEDAHEWCQKKCRRFMQKEIERIVITNTSSTEWELCPYIDLAKDFDYKTYFIIVENRHNGINVHNCPETVIEKMKKRFEIKL